MHTWPPGRLTCSADSGRPARGLSGMPLPMSAGFEMRVFTSSVKALPDKSRRSKPLLTSFDVRESVLNAESFSGSNTPTHLHAPSGTAASWWSDTHRFPSVCCFFVLRSKVEVEELVSDRVIKDLRFAGTRADYFWRMSTGSCRLHEVDQIQEAKPPRRCPRQRQIMPVAQR